MRSFYCLIIALLFICCIELSYAEQCILDDFPDEYCEWVELDEPISIGITQIDLADGYIKGGSTFYEERSGRYKTTQAFYGSYVSGGITNYENPYMNPDVFCDYYWFDYPVYVTPMNEGKCFDQNVFLVDVLDGGFEFVTNNVWSGIQYVSVSYPAVSCKCICENDLINDDDDDGILNKDEWETLNTNDKDFGPPCN